MLMEGEEQPATGHRRMKERRDIDNGGCEARRNGVLASPRIGAAYSGVTYVKGKTKVARTGQTKTANFVGTTLVKLLTESRRSDVRLHLDRHFD